MNKKGVKKIFANILRVLSYLCLAILFFIAAFLIYFIVSNQIARAKGERPTISIYTIVSPSMEPKIMVYDVIMDFRIKDEDSLSVGDIITFYSDEIDTGGYTVTHRIHDIYIKDGIKYYITKGDNNIDVDDGAITFDNIVGKCHYIIPDLGKIQLFISSKFGWALIILIPALGIIIADIKKLIKIFRIKEQIEDIPQLKEVELIKEKEEDKKLRAVVEEANRMNKGMKNE
ncbi:MAG: signal peptidase I [Erysipelotrichales bacterium]|nr:signal peptidase I [Erysipelotrichales bacterium]